MILRITIKSLALLIAAGVDSSTGSHLRGRRRTSLIHHGHHGVDASSTEPPPQLRRGPASSGAIEDQYDAIGEEEYEGRYEQEYEPDYEEDEDEGEGEDEEQDEAAAEEDAEEYEGYEEVSEEGFEEEFEEDEEEKEASIPAAVAAAAAAITPSLSLDKTSYIEADPISVSFSIGAPSHPYYSSSDAPSQNLDRDYPNWSVGLFMRDADPQGGSLAPLVRTRLCAALADGCAAADQDPAAYTDLRVEFGSAWGRRMDGLWPLQVGDYGTGFDAYVLDGHGAAAIGPLSFEIHTGDGENSAGGTGPAQYRPAGDAPAPSGGSKVANSATAKNPLLKYHKGITKATGRHHATASAASRNVVPPSMNDTS